MSTDTTTISGTDFEYTFDHERGTLSSIEVDGRELLSEGPLLNVWRTPISNENVDWGAAEVEEWRDAGLDRLDHEVTDVRVESVADSVTRIAIATVVSAPDEDAAIETDYLYHVLGTGDILLGVRAVPNAALGDAVSHWLPRVGVRLELVDGPDRFDWYGRGPQETYPDRKHGTKVGVYGGSVEEQYHSYVRPQEYGNKTDVRWATVSDGDTGLAAFGHPKINVSAHHVDPDNLDRAVYEYQIRDRDGVTLHLDHAVTGVGGTPVQTLPEYRVSPDDPFEFVVGLRPIRATDSPMDLSKRTLPYAFASDDTYGNLSVEFDEGSGEIDVRAVVRNAGKREATIEAPLKINGEAVETREVTLEPGAKTDVSFTRTLGEAGVFEVTVADLPARSLTVPKLSLPSEWLFRRGDDIAWKEPGYDDGGWETVTLPANWEDHSDYTENDAYGWYRTTLTVPEQWAGHALEIPFGKIDDVDETFVNGTKVGQTGSFPDDGYETAWSQIRRYTVPPEVIDFGGENVVAVRVYDGDGEGGLYGGPLGPITATDGR